MGNIILSATDGYQYTIYTVIQYKNYRPMICTCYVINHQLVVTDQKQSEIFDTTELSKALRNS